MTREIKFRAWDKENKEWIKDFYIIPDTGEIMIGDDYCGACDQSKYSTVEREIIVMQYTRLKDKNGKEIYEKDILANDDRSYIVVIDWCNETCGYEFFKKIEHKDDERLMISPAQLTLEIIGNIYEDKNLLTNK